MLKVQYGKRYKRLIEPFEEMYLAGLSTRDIARLLNVAKSVVAKRLQGLTRDHSEAAQLASYRWSKPESTHWRTKRAQARKIVEKAHGIKPLSQEHVHHKDGNYLNNSLSNLEVKYGPIHLSEHHKGKKKIIKTRED